MKKSYTLTELMVVLIIVGVLAVLAIPIITGPKEQAMDNEAKVNLKLIQAAQKIYNMEYSQYWPASGATSNQILNDNLWLSLPSPTTTRNWNYTADGSGNITATRFGGTKSWVLNITATEPYSP